nr:protein kinase [Candidatus Krumholzibacteria bacterium]
MVGKTLLHYEVLEQIGKGGMGEVFKARDSKLGREVALNILPPELVGDPEREMRFQREARALASLQHPNVASVYGFEEVDDVRFLVMELIAGTELTPRMKEGPFSVAETRDIARQIASGLEAAHECGIVHRDLKPGNVMINNEGEVKILDFGLAQAWFGESDDQSTSGTNPTMTAAMTQVGAILGTAAYMSPEQARGANVDRRADIWAFGVLLFELLTGKQLFQGETISDTLAAVLRAEPEWELLPVDEAPGLCRLIERCLERNPKQRLRDIGEARIFLQDGDVSGSSLSFSVLGMPAAAEPATPGRTPVFLLAAVAALCLAAGGMIGWKVLAKSDPPHILHTMIPPPESTDYDLKGAAPGPATISPDGSMVAFSAADEEGASLLYLRHLDKGESVALSGTEGAAYPFWSPDSKFIGYFDNEEAKLRKVAVAGGPPVTLCVAENVKGGSWNEHGEIIFAPTASSQIFMVPAIGGEPQALTKMDSSFNSHRHPRFLPGGREFLFVARPNTSSEDNTIFRATMDTSLAPVPIARSQANFEYAQGHLLTVREGVLMATPYLLGQDAITEGGTPIVENILTLPGAAVGVFSVAENGMVVFQTGAATGANQQLYWTELENGGQQPLGEVGQIFNPFISPDGKLAIVEDRESSNEGVDLWLVDLETGLRTRFTFAQGDEQFPCWSADGKTVYYTEQFDQKFRLMEQPVEGQGGAAILIESDLPMAPSDCSPDGKFLLLNVIREEDQNVEMHILDLQGQTSETTLLASTPEANLGGGMYSPDGRWIAFHTNTAAAWDVFVMPASGGPRKWQVSTDGSVYPNWNSTGTELFVSRFNGDLRSFEVDGSGETFRVGKFRTLVNVDPPTEEGRNYDLHPDDTRILQAGIDPAFRAKVS